MAALDFPSNPIDGQVFGNYTWSSSTNAWKSRPQYQQTAIPSPTAPTSANTGDIWVNTSDGTSYVYYDDGTSKQWIELIGSGIPASPISVTNGGTGNSSLTSGAYLKGNGTSAVALQTGIPATDLTSGRIPDARMPYGSVLRSWSSVDTTPWSGAVTANTWYSWPGNRINLSIAPSSTANRILLIATVDLGNNSNDAAFRITREGTPIAVGDTTGSRPSATGVTGFLNGSDLNHTRRVVTVAYIDSPNTTAYRTYILQYMSEGGTMYINRAPNFVDSNVVYNAVGISSLIAMELAG